MAYLLNEGIIKYEKLLSVPLNILAVYLSHMGAAMAQMSRDMGFPTMWYVQPAKPQISLHICAV